MVLIRSGLRSLRRPSTTVAALVAALAAFPARADLGWYFQSPVTETARSIERLHDFIFWICVVIFVGVFGTMFYSLFKHRKSVSSANTPARTSGR